jgi:serine/threonine protein kinase/GTPase SAR1 family protein
LKNTKIGRRRGTLFALPLDATFVICACVDRSYISPINSPLKRRDVDAKLIAQNITSSIPKHTFSLFDFSGHQRFSALTSYFLQGAQTLCVVFSMEQLQGDEKAATGNLAVWLDTAALYSRRDNRQVPIFLIGTHKDNVSSVDVHQQLSAQVVAALSTHQMWPAVAKNVISETESLLFFPVDATGRTNDSNLDKLLKDIELYGTGTEAPEYPINWLKVYDQLVALSSPSVSYSDVESIAGENGVLEAELLEMLQYMTDIGMLAWFDDGNLRNQVIIDVKKAFIEPISRILDDNSRNPDGSQKLRNDQLLMLNRGMVTKDLLLDLIGQANMNLVPFLLKHGIVVPWELSKKYLIPSLFPEDSAPADNLHWTNSDQVTTFYVVSAWSSELSHCVLSETELQEDCFFPLPLFYVVLARVLEASVKSQEVAFTKNWCILKFGNVAFRLEFRPSVNLIQVDVEGATAITVMNVLQSAAKKAVKPYHKAISIFTCVPQEASATGKLHLLPAAALQQAPAGPVRLDMRSSKLKITFDSESVGSNFSWLITSPRSKELFDVFISYPWNDAESQFATSLASRLSDYVVGNRMMSACIGRERLRGKHSTRQYQFDALTKASVVVVLLSPRALETVMEHACGEVDDLLLEWLCALALLRIQAQQPDKVALRRVLVVNLFDSAETDVASLMSMIPNRRPEKTQQAAVELFSAVKLKLPTDLERFVSTATVRGVLEHFIRAQTITASSISNTDLALTQCVSETVAAVLNRDGVSDSGRLFPGGGLRKETRSMSVVDIRGNISQSLTGSPGSQPEPEFDKPRALEDITTSELGELLASWDLEKYVEPFKTNSISGASIGEIPFTTPEGLMESLRVMNVTVNLVHARQMFRRFQIIKGCNPEPLAAAAAETVPVVTVQPAQSSKQLTPSAKTNQQVLEEFKGKYKCNSVEISILASQVSQFGLEQARVLKGEFLDARNHATPCIVKRSVTADEVVALQREINILQKLHQFPAVVEAYYFSPALPSPYFVLENFGDDLLKVLTPTTPRQTCEMIAQKLIQCVTSLHSKRIMHGDLKPQNILYRMTSQDIEVKLCDLDSAATIDEEVFPFVNNCFKYTPGFECPEFVLGHNHSARPGVLKASASLDYFTLGLVLCQLFNGQRNSLFSGRDSASLLSFFTNEASLANQLRQLKHCTTMAEFIVKLCRINPTERVVDASIVKKAFGGVTVIIEQVNDANEEIERLKKQLQSKFEGLNDSLGDIMSASLSRSDPSGQHEAMIERMFSMVAESNRQMKVAIETNRVQQTNDIMGALKDSILSAVQRDVANSSKTSALESKLSEIQSYLRNSHENQQESAQAFMACLSRLENDMKDVKEDIRSIKTHMIEFGDSLRTIVSQNANLRYVLDKMDSDLYRMEEKDRTDKANTQRILSQLEASVAALPNIDELYAIREQISQKISGQSEMLNTLIRKTYDVPTLMVLFPDIPAGVNVFDPRRFVQDSYRLCFLCSHTLRVVTCGPKGNGYLITAPKHWVKKAAPVLLVGLCLLKVGMAVAGIPPHIPGLPAVMQALGDAAVDQSSNFVHAMTTSVMGLTQGDTRIASLNPETIDVSMEGTREAYLLIKQKMEEVDRGLKQTGLRFVTDKTSGISQWIADDDEVEKSFRANHGARQSSRSGLSSIPSQPQMIRSKSGANLLNKWFSR